MLKIKNIYSIIGKRIQTTNAEWVVLDMYETKNDYMIKVRLTNNTKFANTHMVNFRLLRYNTFDEQKEWRMYNDQNIEYITLTKGYLHDLKVFVGILGGQLNDIIR